MLLLKKGFENYTDIKGQHSSFLKQLELLEKSPIDYRKFLCLVMNKLSELYNRLPSKFFGVKDESHDLFLGYASDVFTYDDFKIVHMYDDNAHCFYINYMFEKQRDEDYWIPFLKECGFSINISIDDEANDDDIVYIRLSMLESFIDVFDFKNNTFNFENMTDVFSDKLLKGINDLNNRFNFHFEPDLEVYDEGETEF